MNGKTQIIFGNDSYFNVMYLLNYLESSVLALAH